MKEKDIQNSCLDWLEAHGILCKQIDTVGIYDAKKKIYRKKMGRHNRGTSDIWAVANGRSLAIECKTEYNYLRDDQVKFLLDHALAGGISLVVRSIEDLEAGLKHFEQDLFHPWQPASDGKVKIWSRKLARDFKGVKLC